MLRNTCMHSCLRSTCLSTVPASCSHCVHTRTQRISYHEPAGGDTCKVQYGSNDVNIVSVASLQRGCSALLHWTLPVLNFCTWLWRLSLRWSMSHIAGTPFAFQPAAHHLRKCIHSAVYTRLVQQPAGLTRHHPDILNQKHDCVGKTSTQPVVRRKKWPVAA